MQQPTDPVVLALILDQFAWIDETTYELAEKIAAEIEANASAGTVQNSATILAAAFVLMDAWFADFAINTRKANIEIAKHLINQSLDRNLPPLADAGAPTAYRKQITNKALQYPKRLNDHFYTRTNPADNTRFDHRIKTVRMGSEQTVRNIVQVGKRRGMDANQIAADVRTYLRGEFGGPGRKLSPTELQREAALLKGTAKPKNISTNKIPYAAKRIARSEAGNTYRAAEVEAYEGTIFEQDKYDWVLSNTHPAWDDCDILAGNSPYTGKQRPHSHPNCICAFIKRTVDVETLRRRLIAEGVL